MDWTAMLLFGAYHGINPGMGWLFAVALGMQQGSLRGVFRALPPLAFGHAASVALVLVIAALVQAILPSDAVRAIAAALLVAMGLYRLWRHRHPRYGRMQVGFRELALWSFLMASAHGAGLMVVPFALDLSGSESAASISHASHGPPGVARTGATGSLALGIHTLSYFVVMAAAACVVYRKVGLAVLRAAWFDMDRVWACSVLITGVAVLAW